MQFIAFSYLDTVFIYSDNVDCSFPCLLAKILGSFAGYNPFCTFPKTADINFRRKKEQSHHSLVSKRHFHYSMKNKFFTWLSGNAELKQNKDLPEIYSIYCYLTYFRLKTLFGTVYSIIFCIQNCQLFWVSWLCLLLGLQSHHLSFFCLLSKSLLLVFISSTFSNYPILLHPLALFFPLSHLWTYKFNYELHENTRGNNNKDPTGC